MMTRCYMSVRSQYIYTCACLCTTAILRCYLICCSRTQLLFSRSRFSLYVSCLVERRYCLHDSTSRRNRFTF